MSIMTLRQSQAQRDIRWAIPRMRCPCPPPFLCSPHSDPPESHFVYQLLRLTNQSVGWPNRSHSRPNVIQQSRVASVARDLIARAMTQWRDSMNKAGITTEAAAPSVAIHVDHYDDPDADEDHSKLLDLQSPPPIVTPSGQIRKVKSFTDTHRFRDVSTASGAASARCLRPYDQVAFNPEGSECGTNHYGAPSVRSLASIGMGCTDGRKMVIRRVPTSPTELFHLVRPPTWVFLRVIHPLSAIIQLTQMTTVSSSFIYCSLKFHPESVQVKKICTYPCTHYNRREANCYFVW